MVSRQEVGQSLNLEISLIPTTNRNRPGTAISPNYITIHNTANNRLGADALAHARFVERSDTNVSWHYTVDDQQCIKHLPINERGWHAGTRAGNNQSIGIEICMNEGIDQAAANTKAATLVAVLMYDLTIPLENVVTHHKWSTKQCPMLLLDPAGHHGEKWKNFIQEVSTIYQGIEPNDDMVADLFGAPNSQMQAWLEAHSGEEDEIHEPVFCQLPVVPVRTLDENIAPSREALIRSNEKKWVNQTVLHYHFLDSPAHWKGDNNQKEIVRQSFRDWRNLGIGLEFVEVSDRAEAEIRIGFEGQSTNRGRSWSYVGRDAIDFVPNLNERTMNFGWDLTTPFGKDTALHEIGHALGFHHEHQNPNAGIVWDEEAVYTHFAGEPNFWPREVTYRNILHKISPTAIEGSLWDKDSIMHYSFAAGLIQSPSEFETHPLIPVPGLSPTDIAEVKKFYPGTNASLTELRPSQAVTVNIHPSEQLNFVIRPNSSRNYTIQTLGELDTVIVLFEEINGSPVYMAGDDDSGTDYNAQIRMHLIKDRVYILRLRLYSSGATGQGVVILL